jgi:hypothetical protein
VSSTDGPVPYARAIARFAGPELEAQLTRLEATVPQDPTLAAIASPGAREVILFGDTHGDWPSTEAAAHEFLLQPDERLFVGLGDYVDRPPPDCPGGSVVNALYLLALKSAFPDRVFLIQGNHENARRIPLRPHTLPAEVARRWQDGERAYLRIRALLERGPLAGFTPSGVYLAHAGFPSHWEADWKDRFRRKDEELIADLTWRDADASEFDRGVSPTFGEEELRGFLAASDLVGFVRGHDPDLTGRQLYADRCLTLHTARQFQSFGGVLIARVPMDRPLASLRGVRIEHLSTEGKTFGPDPVADPA